MKEKNKIFKSSNEFGKFLGLSDLEIEVIHQKKKLIEKLKKAREGQEISQSELAKRLKTKQPAIARMESSSGSETSLDFLAKVAIVLGVSFTFKSAKLI